MVVLVEVTATHLTTLDKVALAVVVVEVAVAIQTVVAVALELPILAVAVVQAHSVMVYQLVVQPLEAQV